LDVPRRAPLVGLLAREVARCEAGEAGAEEWTPSPPWERMPHFSPDAPSIRAALQRVVAGRQRMHAALRGQAQLRQRQAAMREETARMRAELAAMRAARAGAEMPRGEEGPRGALRPVSAGALAGALAGAPSPAAAVTIAERMDATLQMVQSVGVEMQAWVADMERAQGRIFGAAAAEPPPH
jgi:uncharacterized small protein (DUF1192 family)